MKLSPSLFAIVVASFLYSFNGCKQRTAAPSPNEPATLQGSGGEHVPAVGDDDRDHSVAGHGHGSGPHEGTLADWGGGKYHIEFTVDHDKQQATVFVLGGDEKTATPIAVKEIELTISDPEMQVILKAAPQEGDSEGTASRFVGNHEKLGVVQEYAGTITGVIDDTPYSGDFAEVGHDHSEHDH